MLEPRDVGGPIVLVSNTDPHFGAAVARHLQGRGWAARHVPSAREALYRWEELRPRWVVAGFDDGEVDGFEFLQSLTARAAVARLPRPEVVICAREVALAQLGPAIRRLLGIDLLVPRPCRLEAIGDALSSLLVVDPQAALRRLGADAGTLLRDAARAGATVVPAP